MPEKATFETETLQISLTSDMAVQGQSHDRAQDRASNSAAMTNFYTWGNSGFLLQYFVVGLVYGGLPATLYPVLQLYLNVPGYVYGAARAMATLPWSFKAAYGALHDLVPIRGYRRKPWMAIGWTICGLALLLLTFAGLPAPYWCTDDEGVYVTTCDGAHLAHPACAHANATAAHGGVNVTAAAVVAAEPCNASAAEEGGHVAMLFCLACLGYVCADVAADGLTVTYAQQEPLATRGRTQSTVYLIRSLGFIASALLVGFGMNGREYGGSFGGGLSFEGLCATLAVPCFAMVPASIWLVRESPVARPRAGAYFSGVWGLLKSNFFLSIILFDLVYSSLSNVNSPGAIEVTTHWAHVQNLQKQLFGVFAQVVYSGGLLFTKRYLLGFSWRWMIVLTSLSVMAIDVLFSALTVFDVVRNQYFYLGEAFLVDIPLAVQFLVTTFVVVEAAGNDNGGLVYGLLTTASNIGLAFSTPLSNQIFGGFTPSLSDADNFIADAPAFRQTVFNSLLIGYLCTVISFVVLPLLPDQKAQTHERRRTWGQHKRTGQLSIALLLFGFVYSSGITVLTMFPASACLKLVGGEGC